MRLLSWKSSSIQAYSSVGSTDRFLSLIVPRISYRQVRLASSLLKILELVDADVCNTPASAVCSH